MAAKEKKYGDITASGKVFHPDEPVFLIRSTDPLGPTAVMLYHALAVMAGCTQEFRDEVLARAGRMEQWQHEHPTLVKQRPD